MNQLQEVQAQFEQWKAMGLSLNDLQAAAQTAYTSGTTPLGLNQWSLGDKPRMEDFNRDNARVDALISELRGELARKVNVSYEWYDLELQNGFTAFGGATPQFCKIGGVVHFHGVLCHESGTTPLNTTIAELPEGFRPSYTAYISVSLSSSGGGGSARLSVSTGGILRLSYTSNQQSLNVNSNLTFCYAI